MENLTEIDEDDIEFGALKDLTYHKGINPLRWERVRQDIRFEDVVAELTGKTGQKISCPFHGPETVPSFQFYRSSNSGWCFGCPAGSQFYDAVGFAAKILETNKVKALRWLEKEFSLPAIDDVELEDTDENLVAFSFEDLSIPYASFARKEIQRTKDVQLAKEYLQIYFQAQHISETSTEEEQDQATLLLAEVLGIERLRKLKSR